MSMRHLILAGLCLALPEVPGVLGLLGVPAAALAQDSTSPQNTPEETEASGISEAQALELFNSIFGDRLKEVAATRDLSDDLGLAIELLELARNSKDTPVVFIQLCEHAYKLSFKNPKGHETASDALQLLFDNIAERKPLWLAQAVDLRQNQFAGTRNKQDKTKAGDALIEALVMLGDLHLERGEINDSVTAYRRAMGVASSIRSQHLQEVKAKFDSVAARQRIVRKAEQLDTRFEANPEDANLARQLVQIYLVDLDDPVAAAKYALQLDDVTLIENIARMTQLSDSGADSASDSGADSLAEQDSKALGRWYKELAGTATTDQARMAMLTRARFYHQEFLNKHGGDDLMGKAFEIGLKTIEANLAKLEKKLEKTGTKTAAKSRGGRIIDLMRLIDPAKHTVSGTWQRNGKQLGLTETSPYAKIRFPVIPQGSYELSIEFTRVKGQWSMGPILPVGKNAVALQLSYQTGDKYYSGLHELAGKGTPNNSTTREGTLIDGKRYLLTVRVLLVNAKNAKILAYLNGKPYLAWQGAMSDLSQSPSFALTDPISLGFVAYNTQMVFHSIKLKMLSGKAIGLPAGK